MTPHPRTLLALALLLPALGLAEGPAAERADARAQARAQARPESAAGATAASQPAPVLPPAKPIKPADAEAATAAAVAYLGALKDGGFAAAPAHLHPQALERFKTLIMPRLDQDQARGTRSLLNATFGRDASFASARSADPADFMARFVRVIVARDPQAAPRFGTPIPLGIVAEGDRLHVLFRLGGEAGREGSLEVVSLKPQGTTWKVLLDSRLESLASALGGPPRGGDRRGVYLRMEPMPEGSAPLPVGPQGPAGLPTLPPTQAAPPTPPLPGR